MTASDRPPPPEPILTFVFDECIPPKTFDMVRDFVATYRGEQCECVYFTEVAPTGASDEWVIEAHRRGWVPVTADRGKGDKRSPIALPAICERIGLLHFRLSATLHQLKWPDKGHAIVSVWPTLIEIARAAEGCRWTICGRDVGPGYRVKGLPKAK